MARPNKQQHKIPECYLKAFTDESGVLWVADERYNLRASVPGNVLTEKDYYTVRFPDGKGGTLFIEKEVLASIEAEYARIYKDTIKPRKTLPLEDRAIMSVFIASMMERAPAKREVWKDFFDRLKKFEDFAKDVTPEQAQNFSIPLPKDSSSMPLSEALKAGEDVGSLHSSLIPDTVVKTAPIIFGMKWSFMVSDNAAAPFITSDCPCVLRNPDLPEKSICQPGLLQKKVELTIPLSPQIALIAGWEINHEGLYLPIPESLVHDTNKRTMTYARTLICNSEKFLENYIRLEKKARGIS